MVFLFNETIKAKRAIAFPEPSMINKYAELF